MTNIVQQQEQLKNLSDDQIANEMKQPSGQVPLFLVSTEAKRRADLRERFKQDKAEAPQTSVQEDLLRSIMAGQMQPPGTGQGITQGMQQPQMQQPQQMMQQPQMQPPQMQAPQMMPQAGAMQGVPPQGQGFAVGGAVRGYAQGGIGLYGDFSGDEEVTGGWKTLPSQVFAARRQEHMRRQNLAREQLRARGGRTIPKDMVYQDDMPVAPPAAIGPMGAGVAPPSDFGTYGTPPIKRDVATAVDSYSPGNYRFPADIPFPPNYANQIFDENASGFAPTAAELAKRESDILTTRRKALLDADIAAHLPGTRNMVEVNRAKEKHTQGLKNLGLISTPFDAPTDPLQEKNVVSSEMLAGGVPNFEDLPSLNPTLQAIPELSKMTGKQYNLDLNAPVDTNKIAQERLKTLLEGDDPYQESADRLKTREAAVETDTEKNMWLALAQGGFNAAAGTSQNALSNIAGGGVAGLDAFVKGKKELQGRKDKNFDARTELIGLQEKRKSALKAEADRHAAGESSLVERQNNIKNIEVGHAIDVFNVNQKIEIENRRDLMRQNDITTANARFNYTEEKGNRAEAARLQRAVNQAANETERRRAANALRIYNVGLAEHNRVQNANLMIGKAGVAALLDDVNVAQNVSLAEQKALQESTTKKLENFDKVQAVDRDMAWKSHENNLDRESQERLTNARINAPTALVDFAKYIAALPEGKARDIALQSAGKTNDQQALLKLRKGHESKWQTVVNTVQTEIGGPITTLDDKNKVAAMYLQQNPSGYMWVGDFSKSIGVAPPVSLGKPRSVKTTQTR